MFFRIFNSIDRKIIGKVSDQTIHARIDIHVDHPNFFSHHLWKKVENTNSIVCPKPILEKNAKLTDLVTYPGLSGTLLISTKLKNILLQYEHSGIQLFPTSIIVENNEVTGYWIANPFQFDYDCIDLVNSRITLKNDETNLSEIIIPNRAELIRLCDTLIFPNSISIDPLFLNEDCKKQFIIMKRVYGGVGFYVSEKVKKQIEEAGCTGFFFLTLKKNTLKIMNAINQLITTTNLSDNQVKWLSDSANKADAIYIANLWMDNHEDDEEMAELSVKITIASALLYFPETADESFINTVLSTHLPKEDHPYIEVLKEHIQLEMVLERNEDPTLPLANQFYNAVFSFFSAGWDLNMLEPIDGTIVHDVSDGKNQVFKKGWNNGELIDVEL